MFLNIKCVFRFVLQILSEIFLILRRIQGGIIVNVHRFSCKVPIILVNFNETRGFLRDRFSKNTRISNFIIIRPVGDEDFHADGQRGMTKRKIAFRDFANVLKNRSVTLTQIITACCEKCVAQHQYTPWTNCTSFSY